MSPTSAVDTETTREPSETAAASTPSTSPVDVDFTFAMGSMQLQPLELFPETQMYGDSFAFNPVPAHVPVQALHGQDGVGSGIETSDLQGNYSVGELSSTCLSAPGIQAFWQNVNQGDSQWVPDDALQQCLHDQFAPSFCPQPQQSQILDICSDDEPSMPPPSLPLNTGFEKVASLIFFPISVSTNAL